MPPSSKRPLLVAVVIVALTLTGWRVGALATPADEGHWRSLNAASMEALREGDFARGAAAAEKALALARGLFGPRHPSTLTSMNNLAALYRAQGRYGEAEPLYRETLQLSREVLGPRHPNTLGSMNNLAALYDSQGRYRDAEPLYLEALKLSRAVLGPRHPNTLSSMNNLAFLYSGQGRYGEAEPLYRETLQLRRNVLGPRHPHTLQSMNNLAKLYGDQGRYGEAEPLYRETLQLSREALGTRHPSTLTSMNNLAYLYRAQGRYGEAELLYRETLQLSREVLGARHPNTLSSMNNLVNVYEGQGRYGAAEPLYRETLQLRREVLGPRHPDTLNSMNNLAALYSGQGRYGEAEPLYRETLQLRREVLGPRHPDTLQSMNNLATLSVSQGRYGEADPLYHETLQLRREVLGPRHPDTLQSMNNLAFLYRAQGRYGDAEPLYREALELNGEVLGPDHPSTLVYQVNGATNLAALGRVGEAGRQLRAMELPVLTWLGAELYSSEAAGVRAGLVTSQASFQHVVLSLALLPKAGPAEAALAASVVLRLKGLQAEEEACLAGIVRRGADPRARDIAGRIADLRRSLAAAFHGNASAEQIATLTRTLESDELALGRVSRAYAQHLQVRDVNLADLQAAVPPRRALLEIREYQPLDFRRGLYGASRWAGILVTADGIVVRDLGPAEGTGARAEALLGDAASPAGRAATTDLHAQLLAPFAAELAGMERLYLAPDGVLNLVPFAALRGPDGRRLAEMQDVRLLQTGRDLLRQDADQPAKGLLALGGIDFGAAAAPIRQASAILPGSDLATATTRAAGALAAGFRPLPASAEEVNAIAGLYRRARRDESVNVLEGSEASETRLLTLSSPPRVLHLATHGFYRARTEPLDRPMLLAGIALAGANQALGDPDRDGILHAIEAQGLNLEGTELVVLSACETGQGQIDYGEGLSGLVRALRTAGARFVLVTLRTVDDAGASAFIQRFYFYWLTQTGPSDPAAALRAAQREAITDNANGTHTDTTWTLFTLVGG